MIEPTLAIKRCLECGLESEGCIRLGEKSAQEIYICLECVQKIALLVLSRDILENNQTARGREYKGIKDFSAPAREIKMGERSTVYLPEAEALCPNGYIVEFSTIDRAWQVSKSESRVKLARAKQSVVDIRHSDIVGPFFCDTTAHNIAAWLNNFERKKDV